MALGENILLVLGAALGGGGLTKIVSRVVEARKAKTKADADVATRALDIVEEQREDTQQTVNSLIDCERRCARIESLCRELTARVELLDGDLRNAMTKVELLEAANAALQKELDGLYRDLGRTRPSSRPPGPPHVPEKALRVVEERGQRKGAPRRDR